ncbi:MAG TPA: translation elongation factor Ts [Planctomycetales bacterium]|jgi:elongation factor Ts|nr:translation elongation factor Ts [Planctomycetales bacterium]
MNITAAAVDQLRKRTGMQMMKCKAALTEANGDMEKAVEILRKSNKEAQDKVVNRETAEGRIGVFIDLAEQMGAILEVRCESAPVAKSELFVQLATDLAKQIAVKDPPSVEALLTQPCVGRPEYTISERIGEVIGLVRENIKVARFTRLAGILGSYVHHDGTVGVMVQVEGEKADEQILRDVSMHVTARNPLVAAREHVAADRIAKEMEIAQSQANEQGKGKHPSIVEKIAEGKMKTWYAENVLSEQPFVKDDSKTVGQLLASAGLKMVKFVRYKVGEATE